MTAESLSDEVWQAENIEIVLCPECNFGCFQCNHQGFYYVLTEPEVDYH